MSVCCSLVRWWEANAAYDINNNESLDVKFKFAYNLVFVQTSNVINFIDQLGLTS